MAGREISKALALAGLLLVTPALSACGFTPVYGEKSAGVQTQAALDTVEVAPVNERLLGLQLRNSLIDRINPNGEPASPNYRLEITLRPAFGGSLVQPDASTTRYQYTLSADYRLIGLEKSDLLSKGTLTARSAYNVVDSEYATLVARQDAERRAADSLSEDLALRLALYFNAAGS